MVYSMSIYILYVCMCVFGSRSTSLLYMYEACQCELWGPETCCACDASVCVRCATVASVSNMMEYRRGFGLHEGSDVSSFNHRPSALIAPTTRFV